MTLDNEFKKLFILEKLLQPFFLQIIKLETFCGIYFCEFGKNLQNSRKIDEW